MKLSRGNGILHHITSLPSVYGIGDLGPSAYEFVHFLFDTRQSLWQVLPLNPTDPIGGANSPYSSTSAFAGNKLLISPDLLCQDGLLEEKEIQNPPSFPTARVDYQAVIGYKEKLFDIAYKRFKETHSLEYDTFCSRHHFWLEDYALFLALKSHFGGQIWSDWPVEYRDRHPDAIKSMQSSLTEQINREKFLQYIFFKQWQNLKQYCKEHYIQLIGDIPIYVSYDSADVWQHTELFYLDDNKKPTVVAGVPPDYFSSTGQLWGNPIYNWHLMSETKYKWWISRIEHNLFLYDWCRIDHFRGLVAFWQVPSHEETAINGQWVEVPIHHFINTLLKRFPNLPLIGEDLGLITADVREIMYQYNIPGMKVLQFAFDSSLPQNPYAPHNHVENCIVYTGTHDNNTTCGWFENETDDEIKNRIQRYFGRSITSKDIHLEFIRAAMRSIASLVVIPMQDLLGLDHTARMNTPATANKNWEWRLEANQITDELKHELRGMTEIFGRA